MKRIGAVTLGNETDKKFLTGIIPEQWHETVYDHDTYWTCQVKRGGTVKKKLIEQEREYKNICNQIVSEFNEHLMEIYEINGCSTGDHFVVYLRKK